MKDTHDRYANIEVAHLLQRLEEYDGIAVLATNLRRNFDEAFGRRMHYTIEFPNPWLSERRLIWGAVLHTEVPQDETVDLGFLAERFEFTGGNIRNVALAGAFLAAPESSPVTMRHLIQASAREFEKLGRLPSQSEFGEYWQELGACGIR